MASKPVPSNQRPIIIKKIIAESHGAHHGGAWKVAYADFVTAMMAFFLLMWLLGATDEKERKAIADYFTPTLVEMKQGSAGSNSGPFGGDSIVSQDEYPHAASQTGDRALTIPKDASGSKDGVDKITREEENKRFDKIEKEIRARLQKRKQLRTLAENIRFIRSDEGLRIEVVDAADFAMFELSSDRLVPRARLLLREVAESIVPLRNGIAVRGHTDSLPYASGKTMNNWLLSAARAEATRQALLSGGLGEAQFDKIEGVADRQPYSPDDAADPRNRRMSITLLSEARRTSRPDATAP
jgi:chemotaxis protein MotB